jgi:cation transport regulator
MPYSNIKELPKSVREHLPKHAQEIYKEAFNHAWGEYADKTKRRDQKISREEVSHKVAWAAVKSKYEKRKNRWVEKIVH